MFTSLAIQWKILHTPKKRTRKVLVATYPAHDVFVLPNSIDLEDKRVVKQYGVKYGTLHIFFVDGRNWELKPFLEASDCGIDYKYPTTTEINTVNDWGLENIVACDKCGNWADKTDVVEETGKVICENCY